MDGRLFLKAIPSVRIRIFKNLGLTGFWASQRNKCVDENSVSTTEIIVSFHFDDIINKNCSIA
ncbi:hypothetical protein DCC35_06885 [Mangrovivirga cuniculi]|uniref:Uncharacterized protein n=1 Tax=Mangrovivirga cuniculi TaxID=2715131 RepID=A0A4D7K0S8_9BACT|nr:hypothetical protein DCC35_06885 [Mangrovivirga cuniculi]